MNLGLAACKTLASCVLVQPDGWARGEREGYGGLRDVTSLSLSGIALPPDAADAHKGE